VSVIFLKNANYDFHCFYSGFSETPKIWLCLTWREEYCTTDTMSMNIDVSWCASLDGNLELFGGEVKLDAVDCDLVALDADGTEDVCWQAAEDDAVSVSSSAASWSCLHGNSLLETCNTARYFLDLTYVKCSVSFLVIQVNI